MPIEVQIEKAHGKHIPVEETQRLRARLRERADRAPEGGLPAPRRAGRLGPSVHDDGLQERGRRDPHARQDPREGIHLSRPEAGQLVLRLRQRARRSGSRIRGSRRHRDRRRVSDRRCRSRASSRRRSGSPRLPAGPVLAVIWTTTPWTIPANQALNVNPELVYALVATARGHLVLAQDLVEAVPRALQARRADRRDGQGRGARADPLPASALRSRVAGLSRVVRDARAGHGHRPFVAGVRRRGLPVVPPLRHEGRRDPESGGRRRPLRRQPAVLRRREDLGGESADRRRSCASAARCSPPRNSRTATCTAGATARRSSTARRRSGSPAWTTCPAGTAGSPSARCARRRSPASRRRSSSPPGARRGSTG